MGLPGRCGLEPWHWNSRDVLLVHDNAVLRYNHEGYFRSRACARLRIFCRRFLLAKEQPI
jgi:hypothetical protein